MTRTMLKSEATGNSVIACECGTAMKIDSVQNFIDKRDMVETIIKGGCPNCKQRAQFKFHWKYNDLGLGDWFPYE